VLQYTDQNKRDCPHFLSPRFTRLRSGLGAMDWGERRPLWTRGAWMASRVEVQNLRPRCLGKKDKRRGREGQDGGVVG